MLENLSSERTLDDWSVAKLDLDAYLTRIGQTPSIVMPKNTFFPYPLSQTELDPNLDNSDR